METVAKKRQPLPDTRKRILHAAEEEFARKGFAGARMEAIARESKANKAMIHYYFKSKTNLHLEILRRIFEKRFSDASLRSGIEDVVSGPAEKLFAEIFLLIASHFQPQEERWGRIVAWEMAEGKKNLIGIARNFFVPQIERMEKIIAEGMEANLFQSEHPGIVAWQTVSLVVFSRIHRNTFVGSRIQEILFGTEAPRRLLEFAAESAFRNLSPPGRPFQYPSLSPQFLTRINELVGSIWKDK